MHLLSFRKLFAHFRVVSKPFSCALSVRVTFLSCLALYCFSCSIFIPGLMMITFCAFLLVVSKKYHFAVFLTSHAFQCLPMHLLSFRKLFAHFRVVSKPFSCALSVRVTFLSCLALYCFSFSIFIPGLMMTTFCAFLLVVSKKYHFAVFLTSHAFQCLPMHLLSFRKLFAHFRVV